MARVELLPEVDQDFDRIVDHLHARDTTGIEERIDATINEFGLLRSSQLVGRRDREG